jgi:pimeloyl-ACP methyl ester carboxylesterase
VSPSFRHDQAVDHVIALHDGRRLGYSVYGDPDGFPVLNCHGGLLCRFDVEPVDADLRALGAAVLSPDRPGVGLSDRKPGHTTADWADDARELLDALGIERCAVMGWSLGGQYAAAVAARLGDRVTRAAVIAGCPPLDDPGHLAQLNRLDRRLSRLSRRSRPAARAAFGLTRLLGRHAPRRLAKFEARHAPAADAAVMREHDEWLGRALAEGARDTNGLVDEYLAFTSAWGFELGEIAVPVHVYQGMVDELVDPDWAAEIQAAIPDAQLTTYDGEGHMIALTHRVDVVRELLTI